MASHDEASAMHHATLPWKVTTDLVDLDEVFPSDVRARLAERYHLDPRRLRDLCKSLHLSLHELIRINEPEVVGPRKRKAEKEIEKAIAALEAAQKRLDKARDILRDVKFANPLAHVGAPNPAIAQRERFDGGLEDVAHFKAFLDAARREGWGHFLDHPDARKARDRRREVICTSIFNFWLEEGRPLTFTTDPVTNERTGVLVCFVNDLVTLMTEPSESLPGETIKSELDRFQDYSRQGDKRI